MLTAWFKYLWPSFAQCWCSDYLWPLFVFVKEKPILGGIQGLFNPLRPFFGVLKLWYKWNSFVLVLLCPPIELIHMHVYVRYFTLHIKNLKPARSSLCYCVNSAVWTTGENKKGIFSGSLIPDPTNMQHHSSAVASQVQPPSLWLLQWQKIACVDHKSQHTLEKGPHKSRYIGNMKEDFLNFLSWSDRKAGRKI